MKPVSAEPKDLEHFLGVANKAVDLAAEVLRDKFGRVEARLKGHADFVTEADTESQRVVCEAIRAEFPDHGFLGEEGGEFPPELNSAYFWILDPLDGTTNYVHGVPFFSISLALACKDEILVGVVLDPMLNERFTAVRGGGAYLNGRPIHVSSVAALEEALVSIGLPPRVMPESSDVQWMVQSAVHCLSLRRTGSAALNMAYLAAGRFDISWALTTKAWDVAAGSLLIQEAGGIVTNLRGEPLGVRGGPYVAAANRALLEEFFRAVRSAC
ncbi:inositol monophosphatase family protein [Thermogutta sp.]|uniref:inositol monophosphatase family protein n=1 Tax=Thermogutta sp. TaxID=1962930 RepID=UPI003C7A7C1D